MVVQITLLEALIGFRKTFAHVDGHEVVVERSDVSYCSQVRTVHTYVHTYIRTYVHMRID